MESYQTDGEAGRWNYRPPNPVGLNPLFSWPPSPRAVLDWYRGAWLQITAVLICFLIAVAAYAWFLPPLEAMRDFAPGWMLRIWLLNLIPQAGQGDAEVALTPKVKRMLDYLGMKPDEVKGAAAPQAGPAPAKQAAAPKPPAQAAPGGKP